MKIVIHFYLVRHGQTRLNRSRRLQGTTNSPLTKKGIRMAKRLGKELENIRFEAVYTSDLQRTLGLRKILRAFANEEHVSELTELFRTMDGEEEIETSVHLEQRFTRALKTIACEYEGKDCNILIVTHGLILSNFLESLNGDVPLFLVDNSRASRVDYADGKFEIIYINQLKQEES